MVSPASETRGPVSFLRDLRWAPYGVMYRFAAKKNPPETSRLVTLSWLYDHAIGVMLVLGAFLLTNRFWIFREDHFQTFAERRARWKPSALLRERAVAIAVLLATAAVVPVYKWLLR